MIKSSWPEKSTQDLVCTLPAYLNVARKKPWKFSHGFLFAGLCLCALIAFICPLFLFMSFSLFLDAGPLAISMLCAAAFFAGLVDSMVGGGGLIMVPTLFSAFPGQHPATLLGTNKLAAVFGTSAAAQRYARAVAHIPWPVVLPACTAALLGAYAGAFSVSHIPIQLVRVALPFLLAIVAVYTFWNKSLGAVHAPKLSPALAPWAGAVLGLLIGFYDGLFGPGTGAFLLFAFVAVFGYNFLHSTVSAKLVNVSCNIAALLWFAPAGHVLLALGLLMGGCNFLGARVGSALAIKGGAALVRRVLLFVVCALVLKTGWDGLSPWL